MLGGESEALTTRCLPVTRTLLLNATFAPPCLNTFAGLDELGLNATGIALLAGVCVLAAEPVVEDRFCRECGSWAYVRDTVVRELAHVPFGHRPTVLQVRHRRYQCPGCGHVFRHDLTHAAASRSRLTQAAVAWALEAVVCDHLSISRVAAHLRLDWHTVNTAVLAEGYRRLIADQHRLDAVEVLGVDEHVWRHTKTGDKYVTVMVDLTPVRDKTGPARLLDLVPGRSKQVFKTWLTDQEQRFRDGVKVVAMDGFSGFKTAAQEALPDAVTVMDPFHVIQLFADGLDECRRRVQQATTGHRGRKGDPLFKARMMLHTGSDLLTEKHHQRLSALFATSEHKPVETTWCIYQRAVTAYRLKNKAAGAEYLTELIDLIAVGVPAGLPELARLGRTLNRRREDILAYFTHPGSSNGPCEAINGRVEHLRGTALGFRNLTYYRIRALLEAGGFRTHFTHTRD